MKTVLPIVLFCLCLPGVNSWFWSSSSGAAYASGPVDEECLAAGQEGTCEFFNCFERRLPCGREYYIQRLGDHYCNRYLTYMSTFTPAGQDFLRNSQRCVTQRLVEYYQRNQVDCHDLEHDAVAMIGPCYQEHGFCEIIGDNTQQFLQVFQMRDLFSSGAGKLWRELLSLARHCGGQALSNFLGATTSQLTSFASFFTGNDEDSNVQIH